FGIAGEGSVINGQQLSAISYQLSAISSAISYQLSYQLSALACCRIRCAESSIRRRSTMATKQEIISGLELTVAQAKRTTALFADGEMEWKRAGGWTAKEVYTHLAAVAGIVPQLGQGLAS